MPNFDLHSELFDCNHDAVFVMICWAVVVL